MPLPPSERTGTVALASQFYSGSMIQGGRKGNISCPVSGLFVSSHSYALEIREHWLMNVSFHSLKLPVLPLNSGKELVFFELASIVSYTRSSVCLSCERRLAGSTGKLITFGSVAFGAGDLGDL